MMLSQGSIAELTALWGVGVLNDKMDSNVIGGRLGAHTEDPICIICYYNI